MKIFGLEVSKVVKECPEPTGDDTFRDYQGDVEERLTEVERVSRELMTAINRIERKQNRWIDLLNLKSEMNAPEREVVSEEEITKMLGNPGLEATSQPMSGEPDIL